MTPAKPEPIKKAMTWMQLVLAAGAIVTLLYGASEFVFGPRMDRKIEASAHETRSAAFKHDEEMRVERRQDIAALAAQLAADHKEIIDELHYLRSRIDGVK